MRILHLSYLHRKVICLSSYQQKKGDLMKSLQYSLAFYSIFLVLTFFDNSSAQSIYFCEGVDDDGYPINESSTFTIPENGGYLYVLVRLPNKVNCRTVKLMIYNEDQEFENTITIDTEKNWTWFWKKISFYEEGEFIVDVWDCNSEFLVTGYITIEMQ